MHLVITNPPEAEPLTLEEAKKHLRITHDADDGVINALIKTAREMCESHTRLALVARGCSLYLDRWEKEALEIPAPPLLEVLAIIVHGADGGESEFPETSYTVDTHSRPGRILIEGAPPQPGLPLGGIEIQFTAGFGDGPEDIPNSLREGMLRLIAHLYLNRGDAPETAIRNSGAAHLFQPYRLMRLS